MAKAPAAPAAPTGLGTKAKKIWTSTVKEFDLRADELRILEDACREVDLIERMQKELDRAKTTLLVEGSMGQPVASPLVQEIRQHRAIFKTLIKSLALPDEEQAPKPRSTTARAAASHRWRPSGA